MWSEGQLTPASWGSTQNQSHWWTDIKKHIFKWWLALFTIANTKKQPKCPSAEEWIKTIWYIYTRDYITQPSKRMWSNAICSNIDGPRDLSSWAKWVRQRRRHIICFRGQVRGIVRESGVDLLLLFSHSVVSDSFGTPWTAARPAPLSMGFFQTTVWQWVAIPFSRKSSCPRDWTHDPWLLHCRQILYHWRSGKTWEDYCYI